MQRIETSLPGVCLLEPKVFADARGFFMETFNAQKMAELEIHQTWVQDNHSKSGKGTLRGLHYQIQHTQAKLCRVIKGTVLDVAVDVRRGSPHFGQWVGAILSDENKRQIYVPAGVRARLCRASDECEFLYKCSDFYSPPDERGIAWDDPDLNIDWQLAAHGISTPLLSGKDSRKPASERNARCLTCRFTRHEYASRERAFSELHPARRARK
jgi:dTDP-4-dehydrorhamnose 3,5-epimerase